MGILGTSVLSIILGAAGTLVTLFLTYSFNKYTKKTEEYRKKREDKEAEALKKKNRTMLLCS